MRKLPKLNKLLKFNKPQKTLSNALLDVLSKSSKISPFKEYFYKIKNNSNYSNNISNLFRHASMSIVPEVLKIKKDYNIMTSTRKTALNLLKIKRSTSQLVAVRQFHSGQMPSGWDLFGYAVICGAAVGVIISLLVYHEFLDNPVIIFLMCLLGALIGALLVYAFPITIITIIVCWYHSINKSN